MWAELYRDSLRLVINSRRQVLTVKIQPVVGSRLYWENLFLTTKAGDSNPGC